MISTVQTLAVRNRRTDDDQPRYIDFDPDSLLPAPLRKRNQHNGNLYRMPEEGKKASTDLVKDGRSFICAPQLHRLVGQSNMSALFALFLDLFGVAMNRSRRRKVSATFIPSRSRCMWSQVDIRPDRRPFVESHRPCGPGRALAFDAMMRERRWDASRS